MSICLQFCNTFSKYSQIKLFKDCLPSRGNHESFVLQQFKGHICLAQRVTINSNAGINDNAMFKFLVAS